MKQTSTKFAISTALAGCLAVVSLLAAGCGDHAPQLTSEQSKSFDSAPPEVKQVWDKAIAADKANDYETAGALLDSLLKMNLTDQQKQALNAERNAFSERLMKAVDKNDPAAIKAVQDSQKAKGNR